MQASDKKSVVDALAREGLTVISVKEKITVKGNSSSLFSFFSRITPLDKILLARHLSAIVRAGVPLGEAIDILIRSNEKRPRVTKILEEAKKNLQEGHPLSTVFSSHPEYFPPVFTGLVKAGEASGTLEDALENLGNQLMRDYDLRKKVYGAMVYPAILLVASTGVILILLTFVLPRLTQSFERSALQLPFFTQVLITISSFLALHKIGMLIFLVSTISFLLIFFRKPLGKRVAFHVLHHLPISRMLLKELALARFSRTLKNLISSGISLVEALDIVSSAVGDETYRSEIMAMREEIRRGFSLSDIFRKREEYFPYLVTSLITVGERTGSLDRSLDTITLFYEGEVDRSLKSLVTFLEPLLLLFMGLVVGGIAISVLLPLYQLIGQVR